MADRFSEAVRRRIMSRVRQSGTAPELRLRRALWAAGIRYRVQYRVGGARVDVALPGNRLAIFVDGCFWHGCRRHYIAPATNETLWGEKLRANQRRDLHNNEVLCGLGWKVLRIWECEIEENLNAVVGRVREVLKRSVKSGSVG